MQGLRRYRARVRAAATRAARTVTLAIASTAAAALVTPGGPGAATPAYAQDPLPDVAIDYPLDLVGQIESVGLPATMTIGFTGVDPDAGPAGGAPVRFRYLFKRAELPDQPGQYVTDASIYAQHYQELVDFADSAWSTWAPYPDDPVERRVTFAGLPQFDAQDNLIHYLFAVQVMDTTGVVSVGRTYGLQVANVFVSTSLAPLLTVSEPYLLHDDFSGGANLVGYDIVPMMELNFSWQATADHYGAAIAAYRWGWDIADPEDPDDPGWAVPPGLSPAHLQAPPQSFSSGVHALMIRCWDDRDQLTQVVVTLDVVPIPDYANQYPLLLVDDVRDRNSNGWPSEDGLPLDRDEYRDAFWLQILSGAGGVSGFEPARDIVDGEDADLDFRTTVQYRATVWTSKRVASPFSIVSRTFRPDAADQMRYNWLAVYQQYVGNLLLVGSRNQEDFLRDAPYTVPLVLGMQTYPHRTGGFTLLDHFSPSYLICGTDTPGQIGRRSRCSGLKGVALDSDFITAHMPEGPAFTDTILSDPVIDWREPDPLLADLLAALDFPWGQDEFYETNLSECDIGVEPQPCPDGPCVEPMLRALTRYGWIDRAHAEAGDDDWPASEYDTGTLLDLCGDFAFAGDDALRAESVPIGYFVHKTKYDKPSQKADVVWGFDPYRFDNAQIAQAIRWVLGAHFGLTMQP